jgi:hypothetical protein
MRTAKEIIDQLRQTTEWSLPNIKYQETMDLINELDEVINSVSLVEDTESEKLDGYEYLLEYEDSNSNENIEEKTPENDIIEETPTPKRGRNKK